MPFELLHELENPSIAELKASISESCPCMLYFSFDRLLLSGLDYLRFFILFGCRGFSSEELDCLGCKGLL